ncbi:DUF4442 domain-containing protein [Moritella viscosa]|uniref:DUF4442 domain-containing protein n=1 Tax=Moritella viscosa TaxID=80854 RepID=UPI0009194233|nr:DUF4442 domain-containing protein [Moritella viscosa]SGY99154.1 Putative uncharacterized protein [Moritella viscosa]
MATNSLSSIVNKISAQPKEISSLQLSSMFGETIKFFGRAGIQVESLDVNNAILKLENTETVQNHIGGIHAAATALLGESATGFLVGMHVPDNRIPLLKSMNINYIRRADGDLKAIASLTETQISDIKNTDKGDTAVKVIITDSAGNNPVDAEFIWAWVPKKK